MLSERINRIIRDVDALCVMHNKKSGFCLSNTSNVNNEDIIFASVRESSDIIAGSVILRKEADLKRIVELIDGRVDYILIDVENKIEGSSSFQEIVKSKVKKSGIISIKPNDFTVDALDSLISHLFPLECKNILVVGVGNVGSKIVLRLVERGHRVILNSIDSEKTKKIVDAINLIKPKFTKGKAIFSEDKVESSRNIDMILGCSPGIPVITLEMIRSMNREGVIIDVGNGTIEKDAIKFAKDNNIEALCLVSYPGFKGQMETIFRTKDLLERFVGEKAMGNFSIISGGVIGKLGDVIVDNVNSPSVIIGVADGQGDVLNEKAADRYIDNIQKVKEILK